MNENRTQDGSTRVGGPGRFSRSRYVLPAALVGLAFALTACTSSGGAASSLASTGAASTVASSSGAASITIHNFMFAPATLTVKPGATVKVTNTDQVTHTLTATKGGFDTGNISAGQSKTFTAPKTPGRYTYICSIHQYMTGTIVVSG